MTVWRGFGALVSAGMLMLSAVGYATAAPPTYTIGVSMAANPASVPLSGGSVAFTVSVTATGTGFFQVLGASASLAGCTIAGPFGDEPSGPSAGRLDSGETWTFTCTVTGVVPGTTNTANAHACHNMGEGCHQSAHDATGQGQVTLGLGADPTEAPPTEAPPTEAPPTQAPPTEAPPTEAPPTEAPPTEAPPTEAPPTQAPPTEAPPTQAPPTEAPPTQAPPTEVPPTQAPPTQAPPTEMPPTQAPPTEVPPTQVPPTQAPTDVPPTDAPPTDAPGSDVPSSSDAPGSDVPSTEDPGGEPSFDGEVGAVGDGATQPNTDSVVRRAMASGPNQSFWLIVGILGLLVGAIVMVSPPRAANRS